MKDTRPGGQWAGFIYLSTELASLNIYIDRFFFFPLTICIFPPFSHKDKASRVLDVISKYVLSLLCADSGWCPEGYKDVENRTHALKKLRGKWRIMVMTSQVVP